MILSFSVYIDLIIRRAFLQILNDVNIFIEIAMKIPINYLYPHRLLCNSLRRS